MKVPRITKQRLRVAFVLMLMAGMVPTVSAYLTHQQQSSGPKTAFLTNQDIAPREGITVVTTDYYGGGQIAAINPDGSLLYHNDTYGFYHDVDPISGKSATVAYVASEELSRSECHSSTKCFRSVIEVLNLSTGELKQLYNRTRPHHDGSINIHDVDKVNNKSFLVAEIKEPDGVYIINTSTGIVNWWWPTHTDFNYSSGGVYPGDWTHLNDVELLGDGRIMVSLRNQDQVVFLNRSTGVDESWTLGEDNNHDLLYEQHNPDYIPRERGGPAVVVADSENRRVIEYQRIGENWEQSWIWQDRQMQWPRDADRLPNGNTLIADTNADRVIEINRQGEIVWSMNFSGPYDVERLSTGDESGGGPSAVSANLTSQTTSFRPQSTDRKNIIKGIVWAGYKFILWLVPGIVINGLFFILPPWATRISILAVLSQTVILLLWISCELYWSPYTIKVINQQY